ncbi:MAG: hypothetical protein GJ676_14880 [Rhodobacteraceae bacterium]|nr:hypothetical protein [Paracoccaceae bacterium]
MRRLFQDLVQNIAMMFRAVTLQAVYIGRIRADFAQIALILSLSLLVEMAVRVPWGMTGIMLNPLGLGELAVHVLGFLLASGVACLVLGLRQQAGQIYVLLLLLTIFQSTWLLFLPLAAQNPRLELAFLMAGMVASLWCVFAIVFSLAPGSRWLRTLRSVAVIVVLLLVSISLEIQFPAEDLFWSSADLEQDDSTARIDTEALYYRQPGLMAAQIDAIPPSEAGEADLFVLAAGGYAYEQVFKREVEAVPELLDATHGAGERQMRLLNSVVAPDIYPLANKTNMEAAFRAMADRMQTEDVALIYLTTHGSPGQFSLSFWEMSVNEMHAEDLATMLDRSGLRNAVIVISACYSGSFIEPLQAPDRMIVTAASDQTTSFGCSDASEWTWFGRAYFVESLFETPDFRMAFARARAMVAEWEQRDGLDASEPQIWVGAQMDPLLDHFFAVRQARSD